MSDTKSPPVVFILWNGDTASWFTRLRNRLGFPFGPLFGELTEPALFFARSPDGGATFGKPINVSNTSDSAGEYQLGVSRNMVLITWVEGDFPRQRILLTRSVDRGITFNRPVILSSKDANYPRLIQLNVSGQMVVVTWVEGRTSGGCAPRSGGGDDIFLIASTDGGITFSSPINLSKSPASSSDHQVAITGRTILVTWKDSAYYASEDAVLVDILLARSTDGGATFGPTINLSRTHSSFHEKHFTLVTDGNIVLIAWQDDTFKAHVDEDIFLVRSTDGGASFGSPMNLSRTSGSSKNPSLLIVKNTVIVVWQDNTTEAYRKNAARNRSLNDDDIFMVRSTDGGSTFSHPANLSLTNGLSMGPHVDVVDEIVTVAWTEYPSGDWQNDSMKFVIQSTDGGTTFGSPINIPINIRKTLKGSWTGIRSMVTGNNTVLAILYTGTHTGQSSGWLFCYPSKYDIFITHSADKGSTYGLPIKLRSYTGFFDPQVAFLP